MIIALDSFYRVGICNTSMVVFEDMLSNTPTYVDTIHTKITSEYIPGQFYKRELPGIKAILNKFESEHPDLWEKVDMIIVDSFIYLATNEKNWDGLGAHLYYSLKKVGKAIPIIGVAKTNFGICDTLENTKKVYRGESKRPLYVQSIGFDDGFDEKEFVENMNGNYRIPTMLKEVDRLSRI